MTDQEFYPEYNGLNLGEIGTELEKLCRESDDLDDKKKEVDRKIVHLKVHRIPAMLEDQGLRNFKLANGRGITVANQVYVSVLAADRPEFFKWLRDTGRGSLISEVVNPQTLKSTVKNWIDDAIEYPADIVKVSVIPTAKFYGSAN